jgi:hypothetical protein
VPAQWRFQSVKECYFAHGLDACALRLVTPDQGFTVGTGAGFSRKARYLPLWTPPPVIWPLSLISCAKIRAWITYGLDLFGGTLSP